MPLLADLIVRVDCDEDAMSVGFSQYCRKLKLSFSAARVLIRLSCLRPDSETQNTAFSKENRTST